MKGTASYYISEETAESISRRAAAVSSKSEWMNAIVERYELLCQSMVPDNFTAAEKQFIRGFLSSDVADPTTITFLAEAIERVRPAKKALIAKLQELTMAQRIALIDSIETGG